MKIDISQVPDQLPVMQAGERITLDFRNIITTEDGLRSVSFDLNPQLPSNSVDLGLEGGWDVWSFKAPALLTDKEIVFDFSAFTEEDSDGKTHKASKQIKVLVKAGINEVKAIVNSFDDVDVGDSITLDASNSTSPNSEIVSYYWQQKEGPQIPNFDSAGAKLTFTVPSFDNKDIDVYTQDRAFGVPISTPTDVHIPYGLQNIFDVEYLGAFTANNARGEGKVDFGTQRIGMSEDGKSIFMSGTSHGIAELEVPSQFGFDTDVADVPQAKVLQHYVSFLNKSKLTNTRKRWLNSMIEHNGSLIFSSEIAYDTRNSHHNFERVNGSDNLAEGYNEFIKLEGRTRPSGWLCEIADDMKAELGATHLSGNASNSSIDNRHSIGPSLYTWNADDVINAAPDTNVPSDELMAFSINNQIDTGANDKRPIPSNPVWGLMSQTFFGFIVPNTRKYVCFGSHAGLRGGNGYKIYQEVGGTQDSGGRTYLKGDSYPYFWVFDMDEILNAENPYDVRPQTYGKWRVPYGSSAFVGGAWDINTNTLYLNLVNAGVVGKYQKRPATLAFRFTPKNENSVYPNIPKRMIFECTVTDKMGYKDKKQSVVYLKGQEKFDLPVMGPLPVIPSWGDDKVTTPPVQPPPEPPTPPPIEPPITPPVEPIDPPIDEPEPRPEPPVTPPIEPEPEPELPSEITVNISGTLTIRFEND